MTIESLEYTVKWLFMNKFISIALGAAGAVWYSFLYPNLFKYLFINISIEPVISPCRNSYELEVCRVLARICLWLMDLPVLLVIFLLYAFILVLLERFNSKESLKIGCLLLGYLCGFIGMLIYGYNDYGSVHISYYIVTIATHSVLVILGVKVCRQLTSLGKGRGKASRPC
jgi:hypothetical protein